MGSRAMGLSMSAESAGTRHLAGDAITNVANDNRINLFAAGQHGVVTRAQLLAAGLTARVVERHVRSARLRPLHRGVYLLGHLWGALEPEYARVMAAVLACGKGAVASHRSAAWLWRLLKRIRGSAPGGMLAPGGITEPEEVTVPARSRVRRPGIRVHRSKDLAKGDVTVLNGIPVTTPARTIRDLSAVVGVRELSRAIARAEREGLLDAGELPPLVARHGRRPGAPLLRGIVHGPEGPLLTRSQAEERFLALIRSARLPLPQTNVVVGRHEVDFLWRAGKLIVEVDGFAFHSSRRSFENDRRRDADLIMAGYRVIRATWRQLVHESNATLAQVAQALVRPDG